MIYKLIKEEGYCKKNLCVAGCPKCEKCPRNFGFIASTMSKAMSRIINAIWWGFFLVAIAICSAWWWIVEKIKRI